MKKLVFETLSSTQTYVKENYNKVLDIFVIAKKQTDGRGRLGRYWISNEDNLMFSFIVNCKNLLIENYPLLTLLTGLAVRNTLSTITHNDNFLIKWPNDILYNGMKVCGIIAEGLYKEDGNYVVIGIGINVNQTSFDKAISNTATSLKEITRVDYNKDTILDVFENNFKKLLKELENNDKNFIREINSKYNYLKQRLVDINNDEYKGKSFECIRINPNGNLVLSKGNNREFEINSNEVTLHKN